MRLSVIVKPNSGKQEIEKISENEFRVYLKSLPENGKANLELIRLLKRKFGNCRIVSGKSSRKKVVEVL